MQIVLGTAFLCVIYLSVGVLAEDEIKRGTYAYMAFIYYQDETIVDPSGDRFLQGAVLIRPNFLVSSLPESTISQDPLSKTLLARLGATVIDSTLGLNADEEEQEQEVIQINVPYHHNNKDWSATDICLLKTLQPFLETKAVHTTQLSRKLEPEDKVCHIIIFKKKSGTHVRVLTRMYVEMLTGTTENCGEKFIPKLMACSSDQTSAEEKQPASDFCHGNSGGPLVCDKDVIGLQSYINGDCSVPHLYQLLAPRKKFLDCSIDAKCDDLSACRNVCSVVSKDGPPRNKETINESAKVTESTEAVITTITSSITEDLDSKELITATIKSSIRVTPTTTTITTTTFKAWPNEREGRRNIEETEELPPNANAEARSQNQNPPEEASHNKANMNIVVFQGFIYNAFLMGICMF